MASTIGLARAADAEGLAQMRNSVAAALRARYGPGHWASETTAKSVLRGIETSHVLVARARGAIVATLRLATTKPWAIDPSYFTPVARPLYLLDMAVTPAKQRRGLGRMILDEAQAVALAWPAQAIWLDAYDAPAGAGGFYQKCGFRQVGRVVYRKVPLLYFERLI